jgi:nicotinamide-nucleotide amidase
LWFRLIEQTIPAAQFWLKLLQNCAAGIDEKYPLRCAYTFAMTSTNLIAHHVETLANACLTTQRTIATVESCTGGMVAAACTDLAGSSAWFERGWVTYSNEAKMDGVGVTEATLARHGAVSEETAREMAVGGIVHSRADVSVAITGVAGPSGGSETKPVGMVCFAIARRGADVVAYTEYFKGDRAAVRGAAVEFALLRLIEAVS